VAYFGKKKGLVRLVAKKPLLDDGQAPGKSHAWRSIEVAMLQVSIIGEAMGIPQDRWGDDVRYTQDVGDAVKAVDAGEASAAVFHRPVTTAQLRAVSDSREAMPAKSTFFVPKLLSGAAFYQIGKAPAGSTRRRPTS
jgi:uncharacterized protein (DUF1015 family)